MVFLSRRAALLSIAGAGMSLSSRVLAAWQEDKPNAFDQIHVREMVGARYDPELNTFALLADLGRPGDATARLAVDDLIHLTRIGLAGIRSWAFSLEFDRKPTHPPRRGRPRYVIRYLAEEKASVVQHELGGSRAEKLLVDADTFLKRAAYATDLPGDLALGASQLTLCQIALEEQLAEGGSPLTDLAGPFVLNFNLETEYAYPRELGIGFLFKDARLVVRHGSKIAGAAAPACVQRFAEILNRNLAHVLNYHGPVGGTLRSLKALLMLHNVVQWALTVFVPVDEQVVRGLSTPVFDNEAPLVHESRVLTPYDAGIAGIVYEGGVRFHGVRETAIDRARVGRVDSRASYAPTSRRQAAFSEPRFVVSSGTTGRELWTHLDISTVLGLSRP